MIISNIIYCFQIIDFKLSIFIVFKLLILIVFKLLIFIVFQIIVLKSLIIIKLNFKPIFIRIINVFKFQLISLNVKI